MRLHMNHSYRPSVFFLALTLAAPLSAARVKQVCRRPAEARQFPQARIASGLQDQGVTKPSKKKVKKVVEEADTVLVCLGKIDKRYLEVFCEKYLTSSANNRNLDDATRMLFTRTLEMLEDDTKLYDKNYLISFLSAIRKRTNV